MRKLSEDRRLQDAFHLLVNNKSVFDSEVEDSALLISSQCAAAMSTNRASIWLLSEDKPAITCVASYADCGDQANKGFVVDLGADSALLQDLHNNRVTAFCGAEKASRSQSLIDTPLFPADTGSALYATLRHENIVRGLLTVQTANQHREWTREDCVFITSAADLFSQCLMAEKTVRGEAQHKALFEASEEGILVFGAGVFVDANPAMCKIFNASREQILGKNPLDFSPEYQPDGQLSAEVAMDHVQRCLQGTPQRFEWVHCRLNGVEFDAEITLNAVRLAGEDTLFATIRDISEQKAAERKARDIQREIEYRAAHDSLTDLMNRDKYHSLVDSMIADAKQQTDMPEIALLLFDLNRFQEINDTLGHALGDELLQRLANVFDTKISPLGGCLFRLGGDEFAMVFNSHSACVEFEQLEELVCETLKTPIVINDIQLEMSASIGIAKYPSNGGDSQELLRCADVAMYHAKHNEGASPWYDSANDINDKRRLSMIVELGQGIRENQLMLHFQPRVNLRTGEVSGCEALVRWNHPKLGLVPPDEFISIAEMSDLIHPLTDWVLENVVAQIKRLRDEGFYVPVAMNISARSLTGPQFIETIEKLVSLKNIDMQLLELEITESALISHPQRALNNLNRLEQLGLSIAIDDFGTGYSSLSYLKKLPVNMLKIDRSFVTDMLNDQSDIVIIDSTIHLAHNFRLKVVAEGVEDQQTLNALLEHDCDQAQGYHIARPMPADDFMHWLSNQNEQHPYLAIAA